MVNFSCLAPSMNLGFSAVTLPTLTNESNPHALTTSQASWFASIASLATPFGCLCAGPIADTFGRTKALICTNIVGIVSWVVIALAYYVPEHQYPILLVGRVGTGISMGLAGLPASVYMAEISCPTLRGVFCTWTCVSFVLGVLIIYFFGALMKENWGLMSWLTAVFPCIGLLIILLFVPESPSWLINNNRLDEAKKNMCTIFGTKEYIPEVEEEVVNLMEKLSSIIITTSTRQQIKIKLKHFLQRRFWKPFLLLVIFFFFQEFSGTFSILFYAIDVVHAAKVDIDPYLTIVLIAIFRLLGSVVVSYISKLYGRRPLSIWSGAAMTLSMFALGGYVLAISQGEVSKDTQQSLKLLPVVLLLIYCSANTMGFLPIPFLMAAEVFPASFRGTATAMVISIGYFFIFITVKIYPDMMVGMDKYGVFFFYGAMSLAGIIYVATCLPETKDETLQEIQDDFLGHQRRGHSSLHESERT